MAKLIQNHVSKKIRETHDYHDSICDIIQIQNAYVKVHGFVVSVREQEVHQSTAKNETKINSKHNEKQEKICSNKLSKLEPKGS